MPVDTTHSQYDDYAEVWAMMDDVLKGQRAVKKAGDRYLPMLVEQDPDDYERYKERGVFFGVTSRTREALMGFVFRKPAKIEVPRVTSGKEEEKTEKITNPILDLFMSDATMTSRSFEDFMQDTTKEVLGKGRQGTLIDWNDEEGRPYALNYDPADIINWQTRRINGRVLLSRVVLHELDRTFIDIGDKGKAPDPYAETYFDQWRELKLSEDGRGGTFYEVLVWRRKKGKATTGGKVPGLKGTGPAATAAGIDFICVSQQQPLRRGDTLTEIPFVFHGPNGPVPDVQKPPLEDLAELNLSMYRTSVDLENSLHICGIPTPWAAGFTDKKEDLVLGSSYAWVTSEPTAQCGFLNLGAEGLKELRESITQKEKWCAALGARMLDQQHNSDSGNQEAFATVQLRQSGETAALMKIVVSQSQSLTLVLAWAYWWSSTEKTIEDAINKAFVALNQDFLGSKLDSQTITSLMQAFIQGGISFETLFWNLQQGEVIPPTIEVEQEKQRVQDGQSQLMAAVVAAEPAPGEKKKKAKGKKKSESGNKGEV